MISETKGHGNLVDFDKRKRVCPVTVNMFTFEREDMVFRFGRIESNNEPEVLAMMQGALDGNGRFLFETQDGKIWTGEIMGGNSKGQYDFSAVTSHVPLQLS